MESVSLSPGTSIRIEDLESSDSDSENQQISAVQPWSRAPPHHSNNSANHTVNSGRKYGPYGVRANGEPGRGSPLLTSEPSEPSHQQPRPIHNNHRKGDIPKLQLDRRSYGDQRAYGDHRKQASQPGKYEGTTAMIDDDGWGVVSSWEDRKPWWAKAVGDGDEGANENDGTTGRYALDSRLPDVSESSTVVNEYSTAMDTARDTPLDTARTFNNNSPRPLSEESIEIEDYEEPDEQAPRP